MPALCGTIKHPLYFTNEQNAGTILDVENTNVTGLVVSDRYAVLLVIQNSGISAFKLADDPYFHAAKLGRFPTTADDAPYPTVARVINITHFVYCGRRRCRWALLRFCNAHARGFSICSLTGRTNCADIGLQFPEETVVRWIDVGLTRSTTLVIKGFVETSEPKCFATFAEFAGQERGYGYQSYSCSSHRARPFLPP